MVGRKAAYAEESAEVEVLFANLDKLNGLTKKIQSSLNRLDTTGISVDRAIGPIYGNTRRLNQTHHNIDKALDVIERLKAPLDQKDAEEAILQDDPKRVGITEYIQSLGRAERVLNGLRSSNISANQSATKEIGALVNYGNRRLEEVFKQQLMSCTENQVEPLQYIMKDRPFPVIPDEFIPELREINHYIAHSSNRQQGFGQYSTVKIFAELRGNYISKSLTTSAAATMSTTRKLSTDSFYKRGTCGIGAYCSGIEGMLTAEFDNIKRVFAPEDCTKVLTTTARPAMNNFAKTIKDLQSHIQSHLTTDCFLAYEILEIVSSMAKNLDSLTSEMRHTVMDLLQPIHDLSKSSLSRLIDEIKIRVQTYQILPLDGSALPMTGDVINRLALMLDYQGPLSTLMASVGDGKWMSSAPSSSAAPSIRSFDTSSTSETSQMFAHYCSDTLETLITQLDNRCRLLHKTQSIQSVFMCNNAAVIEEKLRTTDLDQLTSLVQPRIESWRLKYIKIYIGTWAPASAHLLDTINTSRARSSSGGAPDSHDIVKNLNAKERDNIKSKFREFNVMFDELIARHKSYKMERDVRSLLGREVQRVIEPLYSRFWDRYHEIDKGRGKYVKYTKSELSVVFAGIM